MKTSHVKVRPQKLWKLCIQKTFSTARSLIKNSRSSIRFQKRYDFLVSACSTMSYDLSLLFCYFACRLVACSLVSLGNCPMSRCDPCQFAKRCLSWQRPLRRRTKLPLCRLWNLSKIKKRPPLLLLFRIMLIYCLSWQRYIMGKTGVTFPHFNIMNRNKNS